MLKVQGVSARNEKKLAEESEEKEDNEKEGQQDDEEGQQDDENGDPPLLRGDFVTFRGVTVQVMRVGYGSCENEVRIRLPTEADCWFTGRWIYTAEVAWEINFSRPRGCLLR